MRSGVVGQLFLYLTALRHPIGSMDKFKFAGSKDTMSNRNSPKPSGLKPGQDAPKSGQYEVVGPRGGKTGQEVTSTEGNTLPPTPKPGQTYTLVDETKHKGK